MDFTLTFRYYYRPLCMYAIHYVRNVDTAEDIVQDCFLRLMERVAAGSEVTEVKAYLYQMVRHTCIDHLRKSEGNITTLPLPTDMEGTITDEEAQERSFHEAELWTAIDSLPSRCREIFLLSKRDGMKYREIAQQLGISEKTVEHQISKALRLLRGKSSDYFYLLQTLFCVA